MIYLVIENDVGYLPDTEPAEFDTRQEAEEYMKQIRREWMEDCGASPFDITGSYTDVYWWGSGRVAEIVEVET